MADYSDYKECTDCVHYELCLHQEKFLIEHNRKDLIRRYGFGLSEPEICCNFRDRSRFVELPIKLGEKVFYFDTGGRIYETTVTQLVYGATGFLIDSDVMFNSRLIGEQFFLTREAAEQALKERESNAGRNDI